MTTIRAYRYHDFSYGHRVYGHENKCRMLHGHNGRVHFYCQADELDSVGRVIDFGIMKSLLCDWLESNWDHRFLIYREDPIAEELRHLDSAGTCIVGFNPTAENMAAYLLKVIGPLQLDDTGVRLVKVVLDETRKCSASVSLSSGDEE